MSERTALILGIIVTSLMALALIVSSIEALHAGN